MQSYFDFQMTGPEGGNGILNDVDTRSELLSYDSGIYVLLVTAFETPGVCRPTCGCQDKDRRDFPLAELADVDCVEETADKSICTEIDQELVSVTTELSNSGAACPNTSVLCALAVLLLGLVAIR